MSDEKIPINTSAEEPETLLADKRLSDAELEEYGSAAKSGFLWIFSTTALWQIFSWVCTMVTVRILSPEDYGLVAMPDAIFPYLMMLSTFRLDTWLVQSEDFSERRQAATMTLLLALGLISTVLGLVAAPLLASFYRAPELLTVAQVMCLMFIPRALRTIPEVRLRRELNFKQIALSNLVVGVLRGVFQIALAYAGYAYWSLIWGAIIAEFVQFIWLAIAAGMPRRLAVDFKLFREAMVFGSSATSSTIFWVIFSTADNLVVGRLFGKEALGYYSTAFLLTELPLSKINTVLSPVIGPYYAKLRYNPERLHQVFLKVSQILLGLVCPALVGMAVVAKPMIPLIFGAQWVPMVEPLQVLAIAGILRGFTSNIVALLFAIGEPHKVLRCSAIPALVLPFAFYFLGVAFGMPGIYFSWLIIYPLCGPLPLLRALSSIGIKVGEFFTAIRPPLVCSGVLAVGVLASATMLTSMNPFLAVGVQMLIGGMVYLAAMRVLFRSELDSSVQMIRDLRS